MHTHTTEKERNETTKCNAKKNTERSATRRTGGNRILKKNDKKENSKRNTKKRELREVDERKQKVVAVKGKRTGKENEVDHQEK